jgi:predicted DCC family thiol-disulfide oxidoreductase YuxK
MSDDGPILVFDGVCVLCSRSVQFVLRHDRLGRFRFATTQSETGRRIMIERGLDPAHPASVLLIDAEHTYAESAAAIRVLRSLGGRWRFVASLLWIVPRLLRDSVYRFVARHRYRWFGRRDICYLPQPCDAARFLS